MDRRMRINVSTGISHGQQTHLNLIFKKQITEDKLEMMKKEKNWNSVILDSFHT